MVEAHSSVKVGSDANLKSWLAAEGHVEDREVPEVRPSRILKG